MSRLKEQKSLQDDGWKIVFCRNCTRIIGETHAGEKNTRTVRCKECKNVQIIAPVRLGVMNGKPGAFWCEVSDSCFTVFSK